MITLNLHNSLFNNRYMKVTLTPKLIGDTR